MSKKKGFTLIEVLTVIALLGIIVLLAAPKFLGYTEHARLAHIKNDVKAYEDEIEAQMLNGRDFTLEWGGVSKEDLEKYRDSKKLFNKRGLISKTYSFDDDYYKIEENLIKTRLPGTFIFAENGDVFYYGDGSGEGVYEEPEKKSCLVVEENKESDFTWEFINDNTEVRITGYKGESSKVGLPKEIQNKLVTEIGHSAFYGAGLTDVTFPKTLKKIDDMSFYDNKLTCIDLSKMEDITVMDSFGNNDIVSMDFSDSLISLYKVSSSKYYVIDSLDFSNSRGFLNGSFNSNEFNYIKFNGADLNIDNSSFSGGEIKRIDAKNAKLTIDGNSFSGGSVGYLNFEEGSIFVDGNSFSGGNTSYVSFKNAEFTADGNSFSGGSIGHLDLKGGNISINGNAFSGGDLAYVNLKNAKLITYDAINGGDIGYADFTNSTIEATNSFDGGDIYGANFNGSNVKSVDAFCCDIKISDLSDAKLFLNGYSMNSILIDELDLSTSEIIVDENFRLKYYSIDDEIFSSCIKCDFSKVLEESLPIPSDEDWEWVSAWRTGQKNKDGEEGYFKYVGSGEDIIEIPHVIDGAQITSYYSMFEGSGKDVKKVISTNPNVTDMRYMFYESKATELDLSEFNTSNVTKMDSIFNYSQATKLDLSSFDTSKIVDMSDMFYLSKAESLDLTSFDTSKVTSMRNMFKLSNAKKIKLTSFNTTNVYDMRNMFAGSEAVELDVSSFNTSNAIYMTNMFLSSKATSIIGLDKFDTKKVYDFSLMFANSNAKTLDLSSFDTSSYSNSYRISRHNMFVNSSATKGYSRNESEANIFNNYSHMPEDLKFEVK